MNNEKIDKIIPTEELDNVLPKYEPVKLSGKNLAQQYVSAFNTGMNIYQCVNQLQGSIVATVNGVNNVVKSWNDSVDETLNKSIEITEKTTTEQFNKEWTNKQPELVEQVNTLTTTQFNNEKSVFNDELKTLGTRMDTFTKLAEGSTTGDAELTDIRVGANGITYNTAGDAVRGQYRQLDETLIEGKILKNISLISGNLDRGYIQTNNIINSVQNYAHTKNSIELKPKSTVILKAKGYHQDIVMIAQYVGSTTAAKPLVVSIDNELNTYTYTNDTEYTINVLLSFLDDNTAKAYVINTLERTDSYLEYIKKNGLINIIDKIYPKRIQGAFVNYKGDIVAHQYYFYSEPIVLRKNERISITSSDESGSAVARVSLSDNTGTKLQPINLATTEETTFNYIATNDCYIVVSAQISNVNFHIIKEHINIPEGLSHDIFEDKKETYPTVSMFDDIAVCGDSYTAGSIYKDNSLLGDNTKTRWGSILSRLTGVNVSTYASGGADTLSYQTREDCLPKILTDSPHELYVLCLGINDKERVTLGSLSDIKQDYTKNENTFYGNYGKIISQIKEHAPKAKILISKVFIVTLAGGGYYDYSSKAIEEIANYFSIPFIDTKDEPFFSSTYFDSSMVKGHPVAPTYSGIAIGMKKLISSCIEENPNYFNDYYPS